ncbi:translation initiation factor IF-1 [Candidatus Liberibacter sp.]|uniref:translation initiation factor IF-1 n=1 Tax=Candidatus Liberibacter sp. TaxID=34022 RepID=UPI0021751242
MPKEEVLEFSGIVSELLPNATFRVKLIEINDRSSTNPGVSDSNPSSTDSATKRGADIVSCIDGADVIAYTAGRVRKNRIRISAGDKVLVEITPYDMTRARITYRYR